MLLKNIYLGMFAVLIAIGFLFRKNENGIISRRTDFAFCVAVSVVAATFFSAFPLTKTYTYTDSSVFLYIGKMMQKGLLPYKDLFDHKGILLYFIEYLGILISPNNLNGIWLLELFNMIITTWIMFKIASLYTNDRMVKYISIVSVIIMCGMDTFEGAILLRNMHFHGLVWHYILF